MIGAKTRDLSTFCVMPFLHLFVDNTGNFHPCCLSLSEDAKAKDGLGKPLLFDSYTSVEKAWNSDYFRGLRRDMLSGIKPAACSTCFQCEEYGARSVRVNRNTRFKNEIPTLLDAVHEDGFLDVKFRSADMRLGNQCNFKCRMCSPNASKPLIEEWGKLAWSSPEELNSYKKLDWYEDDPLWHTFFSQNDRLDSLDFAGGEPFLNKRFLWLVDMLVETGRAGKIRLGFHTNLSVLEDSLLEKFAQFRKIECQVSLDGVHEVNSYIRHASRWNILSENLHRLDHWSATANSTPRISATIQAYNALDAANLIEYSLSFPNFLPPWLTPLQQPKELSALVLPKSMRELAIARIRRIADKYTRERVPKNWSDWDWKDFITQILRLIQFLEGPEAIEDFPRFIRRTQDQDQLKNQAILNFIPELQPLFSGFHGQAAGNPLS